ncbi:hypothetical protein H4582DRAFT_2198207 [Lactarius indigo]|nr:hypothetical protein H4582DRAFT_2198207 [Lactarius indigo]
MKTLMPVKMTLAGENVRRIGVPEYKFMTDSPISAQPTLSWVWRLKDSLSCIGRNRMLAALESEGMNGKMFIRAYVVMSAYLLVSGIDMIETRLLGVLCDGPGERLRIDKATFPMEGEAGSDTAGSTDRERVLVETDVDEANADGGLDPLLPERDEDRLDLELSGFSLRIASAEEAGGWEGMLRGSGALGGVEDLRERVLAQHRGRSQIKDGA